MANLYTDFYFHLSTDLDLDVKVFIGALDVSELPSERDPEDLFLTVHLIDGGAPLHPCVRATRLPVARGSSVFWEQWLTLPVKIRDLPRTAQLVAQLWSVGPRLVGGTTVRMFDARLRLKRGLQKCTLWPSLSGGNDAPSADSLRVIELIRSDSALELVKTMEKYDAGDANVPPSPWMDRLAFAQIRRELRSAALREETREHVENVALRFAGPQLSLADAAGETGDDDVPVVGAPFLYLYFPVFPHHVVFEDAMYTDARSVAPPLVMPGGIGGTGAATADYFRGGGGGGVNAPRGGNAELRGAAVVGAVPPSRVGAASVAVGGGDYAGLAGSSGATGGSAALAMPYWYEGGILTLVADPEAEAEAENPVEAKYHRLARGLLRGSAPDPNLKPNRGELARIQEALAAPSLGLKPSLASRDSGDLLWKFRYSLMGNKKALTKFLTCVDWEVEEDAKEAVALLGRWAPIDVEDALRLLGADFPARPVREHAVGALRRASDDDLVLFLLQLVQALRYESDLLPSSSAGGGGAAVLAGGDKKAPAPAVDLLLSPSPTPSAASASAQPPTPAAAPGSSSSSGGGKAAVLSPLADFLIERACESMEVANFLHWYLSVEREDPKLGAVFTRTHAGLDAALQVTPRGREIASVLATQAAFLSKLASAASAATGNKKDSVAAKIDKLNSMLSPGGERGDLCALPTPVAMPLNPLILTCGVVPKGCTIFKSALYPTVITMNVHPSSQIEWGAPSTSAGLTISEAAIDAGARAEAEWNETHSSVGDAAAAASAGGGPRQHQQFEDKQKGRGATTTAAASSSSSLRSTGGSGGGAPPRGRSSGGGGGGAGSSGGGLIGFMSRRTMRHSGGADDELSPSSAGEGASEQLEETAEEAGDTLEGAVTEAVAAATSGSPAATYRVIFKNGDDLRQDQLIIQMIRLMDQQLKRVGLDLRLTPYRVLAMTPHSGVMEMVLSSLPVSAVLATYRGDIMSFFRAKNPREGAEYGIEPEVMDTYVKSAAGYAVITYLLGIGDRHLDNIMLRTDGHLFHVDFGYILGRDPKPFPAPIRLTKEMIDGMGGPTSKNYVRFVRYCCQAYNILRKSANLLLSLLNLMCDAGIEDLSDQPMATIAKLQEKFRLDIDDEAAEQVFLKLVEDSVAAFFPALFEFVHRARMAFR